MILDACVSFKLLSS